MIFSPQKWFCNCCGKEMFSPPCLGMTAGFMHGYRICGDDCFKEMQWRHVLSVMGSEYRPREVKDGGQ